MINKADILQDVGLVDCGGCGGAALAFNLVQLEQRVKRFVELVAGDLAAIDIEFGEERLVEDGTDGFAGLGVDLVGTLQQGEAALDECFTGGELAVSVGKGAPNLLTLVTKVVDLAPELGLGPAFFGCQVQVVVLFLVYGQQTAFQAFTSVRWETGVSCYRSSDGFTDDYQRFGREPGDTSVVLFYRFLDCFDGDVRLVALAVLATPTQPVKILTAVADGSLDDVPPLAAPAEDRSFEVVVVLAGASAFSSVGI
nr:hypothetical protein [Actinomadura macra]